ncbi:MAG: acyl-CoA dehydrogenase family protein, partial [Gemmatimonadota bacterium]
MSTSDLLEIRGLARSFAEAELRPHTERWDAARALDDDVIAKIAQLGFLGMLVPESAGGMGFDMATWIAALEELAWGEAGVALIVAQTVTAADILVRAGGDATLIGELASGARVGCIAFAEDDAGTDLSAVSTRAERRGDGWYVTGRKRWVTNGARADVAIVLADTGDGPALFSVGAAGRTNGDPAATMGLRTAAVTDLVFDAAPATHLTAVAGDARAQADDVGRLSAAAIAVGIAQAALDHAVAYAAERRQFGQPLRAFE